MGAAGYAGCRYRAGADQWFDGHARETRRNVNLGNQFRYQPGYNAAHGYLGLHMLFGNAMAYFRVLGPACAMVRLNPTPELYQSIDQPGTRLRRRRP